MEKDWNSWGVGKQQASTAQGRPDLWMEYLQGFLWALTQEELECLLWLKLCAGLWKWKHPAFQGSCWVVVDAVTPVQWLVLLTQYTVEWEPEDGN